MSHLMFEFKCQCNFINSALFFFSERGCLGVLHLLNYCKTEEKKIRIIYFIVHFGVTVQANACTHTHTQKKANANIIPSIV